MTSAGINITNPENEYVQVDEEVLGLDRANITSQGQIQLPTVDTNQSDDEAQAERERRASSGMVNALKQRKHHAVAKIRKKLHIEKTSDELDTHAPVLANATEKASDSRLTERLPVPEKHTAKDFVHNPADTVKSKVSNQGNQEVAKNIAAKEIPHSQEVDLIKAHDAVRDAVTEQEKISAEKEEARLIKARQSTSVRWSLDRHVMKLRRLPRETMIKKSPRDFVHKTPQGEEVMDWKGYRQHLLIYYAHQYGGQYVGYGSDPPKPSKETILPNIERLIVATSPFQELIMTIRHIYLWEDRQETAKYLVIYLILWYFNLLLPGMLSFFVYLVVERRLHGDTLEDLRQDIKHREDPRATALSLTEFIIKRGDDKWADEIVDVVGPWLMIQLADLANFFESVRNFYEWRKPYRTLYTLIVLTAFTLITVFTPTWLLVKTSTFFMGFAFFALFPLSVKYPEYRLLLSPTKRIFWNIPTHAEWAIQYIQAEGTRVLAAIKGKASGPPIPSAIPVKTSPEATKAQDFGFYKAHNEKSTGRLIISAASCRFVSNVSHDINFQIPYKELDKVEKEDRVVAKKMPAQLTMDSGKDLKLVTKSGRVYLLANMDQRDEAFSQIVGFSPITWQVIW